MPRAFLITNRRYNSVVEYEDSYTAREASPERSVSTAEGPDEDGQTRQSIVSLKPASPRSPASLSRGLDYTLYPEDSPSPYTIYGQVEPLGLTVERTNRGDDTRSEIKHPVIRNLTSRFQHIASPIPKPQAARNAEDVGCRPPISHSGVAAVLRQIHNCELASPIPGHLSWVDEPSDALALTVDSHECPECGKRYSTSSNLARHRQTHRSVTDKKARKCPHCEKVYVSMPAYSMHVRTHSQGCQCPYCGKCFSRPWLLQGHIRTHTGEKPFKCPVCNKAFADKSNLRAHIQTHSTTKPYVCQRCGKAFALKSYLYKHEESSCMRLHRQQRALPRPLPVAEQPFQMQV